MHPVFYASVAASITGSLVCFITESLETFGYYLSKKIAYVYDASGTKLRQAVIATNGTVTKTTDYIGGMQYEGNTLLIKQTAFGRLRIARSPVV